MVRQPVSKRLPVFCHRHIGILIELHWVAREDVSSRCLIAYRHSLFVSQSRHLSVEVISEKFVDSASPVGKELARLLATVNHPSEDDRHPSQHVIVATLLEFLLHVPCPRLRRAFPTVH